MRDLRRTRFCVRGFFIYAIGISSIFMLFDLGLPLFEHYLICPAIACKLCPVGKVPDFDARGCWSSCKCIPAINSTYYHICIWVQLFLSFPSCGLGRGEYRSSCCQCLRMQSMNTYRCSIKHITTLSTLFHKMSVVISLH